MLQTIEFNIQNKLLTREALAAYDPSAESWQKQFARRYTHHCDLNDVLNNVENVDETVYGKFAVSITPYVAQLMDRDDPMCPIRLQYMPTFAEETKPGFVTMLDQLGEEGDTVPGTSIVHRYPRRVLFILAHAPNQVMVGGRETGADAMLAYAGAVNVMGGQGGQGGFAGYKPLTPEAVIAARPDFLNLPHVEEDIR